MLTHVQITNDGALDVLSMLSQDAIQASITELKRQDRLTIALRSAINYGMSIDEASAASGLTPREIRRRIKGELNFGEDMLALSQ